eukprot:scaffold33898_cov222-Skeletonema_dohrnii-CCMP3373.AAC.2
MNADKKQSKKWIKRGVGCKHVIEKLSVSASTWNFENSECRNRRLSFSIYLSDVVHISHPLCSLILLLLPRSPFTEAYLLQAEEQFCSRNFEEAERLYDAAILSSKTHKFVNEEALANELAGHFYLETGKRNRSVHYFSQALEKYNEWGAVAKANTLAEYVDYSGDELVM